MFTPHLYSCMQHARQSAQHSDFHCGLLPPPRSPQDFLTSTSFTLDHPNAALPLRLPAASRIRDALTDAAWVATNSMPAVPPPSTLALAAAAGGASSASNNDGGAAFEARVAAALVATIRTAVEEVGPLAEVGAEQGAERLNAGAYLANILRPRHNCATQCAATLYSDAFSTQPTPAGLALPFCLMRTCPSPAEPTASC